MHYNILLLVSCLITAFSLQSCTDMMCIISGYKPSEIKNDLVTPEPGTEIDARCKLIVKYASKYTENPDSALESRNRLLKILKPPIKEVYNIDIPVDTASIPIRIYCNIREDKRDNLPVIVYYHGGGFVWGSIDVFDAYCRKLARETESVIISVDYRLAPEYPFPYAVNDCYSVLKWTENNIKDYGGDPGKIIVMGESAGGNLAAVMPIVCRDSCGPDIFAQIIVCGATTFEEKVYPSRRYFLLEGKCYLVSEDYMYRCKSAYLNGKVNVSHPYVSPLKAALDKEMPPALVITAQVDPLRDEGKEYAMKMKDAGIEVVYKEYEGMIHAFMNFYPFLDTAKEAIDDVDTFIDNIERNRSNKGKR